MCAQRGTRPADAQSTLQYYDVCARSRGVETDARLLRLSRREALQTRRLRRVLAVEVAVVLVPVLHVVILVLALVLGVGVGCPYPFRV